MFNLVKDIRDLDVEELSEVLGSRVAEMDDTFDAVANLRLHQRNSNQIKYLLARMTAWLDRRCGGTLTFAELVSRDRRHPFEIEHIWANHPERHPEIPNEQAFADERNRFGGLLLLPKDFNASYGDKPYSEKLAHYYGQNVLARSLHRRCYQNNPTFLRLVNEGSIPFEPIEEFTVDSFTQRQTLYQRLCEVVWEPAGFGLTVPDTPHRTAGDERQRYYGVTISDLLNAGLLRVGEALTGDRNGVRCTATVTADGKIALADGQVYETPSNAGAAALDVRACNGWYFWGIDTPRGWMRLSRVRDDFLDRRRA
jgi:hypothetical protein